MVVIKQKKFRKYRGSHTHGGGHKKKRRGAGNRGGRGMAGSGKRADQKKISILKEYGNEYFGKHGFKSHNFKDIKTITLIKLANNVPEYLSKNQAKKDGDKIVINLKELKIDKLLGSGNVNMKLVVTVAKATGTAIEKIKAAGGSVNVLEQEEEFEETTEE